MKKSILLLIVIPLFLTTELHSQKSNFDPALIKDAYHNNGVYNNINQFLTNSPDNTLLIRLDYRDNFLIYFGAKENVLMYFDTQTNKFKRYLKPNWGASISNQVYIKHLGKYIQIQPIGRFSFFTKDRYHRDFVRQDVINKAYIITKPKLGSVDKSYVIDFKTNKRYKLNVSNVKAVLMNEDIDLYNEFIKTEHKKFLTKEFIIKLNNKN